MIKNKNNSGFTLIETLIATLILAVAIVVLSSSLTGSLQAFKKSRTNNTAIILLKRKMAEIEVKYSEKVSELPEDDDGDFGTDFPQYKWKLKSQEMLMPDLSVGLTSKEGGAEEMELTFLKKLSETIQKAVKEVQITVIWSYSKGKTTEFSVSTYFVDFDKEIELGL